MTPFRRYFRQGGSRELIRRVILPATHRQNCPICLEALSHRHAAVICVCEHAFCSPCIRRWSFFKRICPLCNEKFDSWFRDFDLASSSLIREKLPPLCEDKSVVLQSRDRQRMIRRCREALNGSDIKSRPLPWQRSFGRPGLVPAHVIAERKLRWRASVYDRGLRCVLVPSRNHVEQWTDRTREKMLQRIDPWIRRDLRAILGDMDSTVIVHIASSLFIKSLERRSNVSSGSACDQDDTLKRFLFEKTDMFLHELRCFAESSLNMDTYDVVVKYRLDGSCRSHG